MASSVYESINRTHIQTSFKYNILLVYRNQPKRYRTAMICFSPDSSLLLTCTPSPITQASQTLALKLIHLIIERAHAIRGYHYLEIYVLHGMPPCLRHGHICLNFSRIIWLRRSDQALHTRGCQLIVVEKINVSSSLDTEFDGFTLIQAR